MFMMICERSKRGWSSSGRHDTAEAVIKPVHVGVAWPSLSLSQQKAAALHLLAIEHYDKAAKAGVGEALPASQLPILNSEDRIS
ncbi:hypothetical protein Q2941_33875 [Bradyrhizobium sp. UFLA05-153]